MPRSLVIILSLLAIIGGSFIIIRTFEKYNPSFLNQLNQSADQPTSSKPDSNLQSTVIEPTFSSLGEANLVLEASMASLLSRIEALEKVPTQTTSTATSPTTAIAFQPQVVYLGSASSDKYEWTDSSVEVVINSANYPADVSVVFSAGLSIIGGEAWARLKNKTTGAIILITEVSHNNSNIIWKSSPSFKLHSGNNTYIVQLKSTSGETTNLSGARLKITR